MKERIAWLLATWFGCGLSPIAPGTVGTIAALPLWLLLRPAGPIAVLAAALVVTVVGAWSSGIVAKATSCLDPQIVVVDEVAGVLVALAAVPPSSPPRTVVIAVLAFRLFDITKPFPARAAERLPRGWGIVIDDVVAGAWAAAVVLVLRVAGVAG